MNARRMSQRIGMASMVCDTLLASKEVTREQWESFVSTFHDGVGNDIVTAEGMQEKLSALPNAVLLRIPKLAQDEPSVAERVAETLDTTLADINETGDARTAAKLWVITSQLLDKAAALLRCRASWASPSFPLSFFNRQEHVSLCGRWSNPGVASANMDAASSPPIYHS